MERRIPTRLPDAINASPDSGFTQIRNDMLRDPRISCKAKGILCILLSNQSGWEGKKVQDKITRYYVPLAEKLASIIRKNKGLDYIRRLLQKQSA